MILKALRKLEDFKGSVFFVAPFWPTQPWFSVLQSGAKRFLMIPNPVLHQTVGREISYCNSVILLRLAVWIF